jgi:hypothetical protein
MLLNRPTLPIGKNFENHGHDFLKKKSPVKSSFMTQNVGGKSGKLVVLFS